MNQTSSPSDAILYPFPRQTLIYNEFYYLFKGAKKLPVLDISTCELFGHMIIKSKFLQIGKYKNE